MAISTEDARKLFESGHISEDLYTKLTEDKSDKSQTAALDKYGKTSEVTAAQEAADAERKQANPYMGVPPLPQQSVPSNPYEGINGLNKTLPENPYVDLNKRLPTQSETIGSPEADLSIAGTNNLDNTRKTKYDLENERADHYTGGKNEIPYNPNTREPYTASGFIANPDPVLDKANDVRDVGDPAVTNPYSAESKNQKGWKPPVSSSGKDASFGTKLSDAFTNGVSSVLGLDKPQETWEQKQASNTKKSSDASKVPLPTDTPKDKPAASAPSGGGMGGIPPKAPSQIPGLLNRLGENYKTQQGGLDAAAIAAGQQGDLEQKHLQNQQADLAERAREEKVKQHYEQEEITNKLNAIEWKSRQLANQKMDPNRLYNNSSTAQKITGALGLMLGAMGAARTGGTNTAVSVMEGAIDRDLAAQKIDLENGHKNIGEMSGLLKDYMDVTKDRHSAYEAAKLDYMQRGKMTLESIAAKFKSPDAIAKATVAKGQLDERLTEQRLKYQLAVEAAAAKGAGGAGAGAPKGEAEDLKFTAEQLLKEKIPEAEAALANVKSFMAKHGDIMGPVMRSLTDGGGTISAITKSIYGSTNPEASRNEQALQGYVQQYRHALTGAGFSDKESAGYVNTLLGDGSAAGIDAGMKIAEDAIIAKKAAIAAGVGNRQEKVLPGRGQTPREEVELRQKEERDLSNADRQRNYFQK